MIKLKLICIILTFISINSSAQSFQWAKMQANDGLLGTSIASNNEFLVSSGYFTGSINLDGQALTTNDPNNSNGYFIKYDLAGNLLWAKHIISKNIALTEVAIDINNNIYIAGTYQDSLFIDQSIFVNSSPNTSSVFLAKFSSNGHFMWARNAQVSPVNVSPFLKLATDTQGNVYLTGNSIIPLYSAQLRSHQVDGMTYSLLNLIIMELRNG
ncbi:MAG TPA: hypothetical protein VD794_09850 [Flavisolibacter sp.]|nr:hypothetical protein [Flavisolibacter sp.]